MSTLERFGVSMEEELLRRFDQRIEHQGYTSRSEALRDLVRRELVREEWNDPNSEVIGTITVAYEHHAHELANALVEIQHRYCACIVCSTHVHIDEHNCLEVIIVRGKSETVRMIADSLISAKGVKHGQLACTTTGRGL